MAVTTPSYIQVAPNSTGSKVANLEMVVVLPTGAEHTVEVQVVAHVGPDGRMVDVDTTRLLDELQQVREQNELIIALLRDAFSLDMRQSILTKNGRHFRAGREE